MTFRQLLLLVTSVFCTVLVCSLCSAQVSAFPGAEGLGRLAQGGRGGRVIEVTNLNDPGPGSFRAACIAKEPRTVIFCVSGTIDLQTPIVIENPFITIAGQTAPGGGICLKRSALIVETHDAVIRFLRSRPGNLFGDQMDAISIEGESHHVLIDHCSATWSVDECLSPSGRVSNITVQWCLIGESLNRSVHKKGAHGYGSLVRAIGGVTLHHNLWLKNIARNPRLGGKRGIPSWNSI
jgi:pectate lyase